MADQQQAIEADTVSRAEHERKLEEQKDALMGAFRRREEEHERTLATERARAEEAAVIAKSVGDERDNLAAWLAEEKTWRDGMTAELAAANARAGRLDEALERLSQGPWSLRNLETGEDFMQTDAGAVIYLATKFEGLSTAPQASTFIHDQGAINEVSPSPAVGEPAQPAPGGTERKCDPENTSNPEPPVCGWMAEDENGYNVAPICGKPATSISCVPYSCTPTCEQHKCRCSKPIYPTPAEPQGRPEQAGDRVDPSAPTRYLQSADEHLRSVRPDEPGREDAVDNALWCILGYLKELERGIR